MRRHSTTNGIPTTEQDRYFIHSPSILTTERQKPQPNLKPVPPRNAVKCTTLSCRPPVDVSYTVMTSLTQIPPSHFFNSGSSHPYTSPLPTPTPPSHSLLPQLKPIHSLRLRHLPHRRPDPLRLPLDIRHEIRMRHLDVRHVRLVHVKLIPRKNRRNRRVQLAERQTTPALAPPLPPQNSVDDLLNPHTLPRPLPKHHKVPL